MKTERENYFANMKDPKWVRRKRMHYLMMPKWADDKCVFVFCAALSGLICGILSCYFLHSGIFLSLGIVFCLIGVSVLLATLYLCIKGLYRKFLDDGLDAYY